jgi:hypothetical protein
VPLAIEYDEWERAMFAGVQSEKQLREYIGPRQVEPVAPHVNHLIDITDRLREYRNYYVHGINRPVQGSGFRVRSQTSRNKFVIFEQPITVADFGPLTAQIKRAIDYGIRVYEGIASAHSHLRERSAGPPTWPEKPPLPDKLKKRPRSLRDA